VLERGKPVDNFFDVAQSAQRPAQPPAQIALWLPIEAVARPIDAPLAHPGAQCVGVETQDLRRAARTLDPSATEHERRFDMTANDRVERARTNPRGGTLFGSSFRSRAAANAIGSTPATRSVLARAQ